MIRRTKNPDRGNKTQGGFPAPTHLIHKKPSAKDKQLTTFDQQRAAAYQSVLGKQPKTQFTANQKAVDKMIADNKDAAAARGNPTSEQKLANGLTLKDYVNSTPATLPPVPPASLKL